MEISQTITKMIAKQFGVSEATVNANTRFIEDIGAKSLDIMEFIYDIEDCFDITVDDDVIHSLTTVGAAIAYVESVKKA